MSTQPTDRQLAELMRALAAAVPNGRIATIAGATHPMFEQQPVAFCDAVLGFLDD